MTLDSRRYAVNIPPLSFRQVNMADSCRVNFFWFYEMITPITEFTKPGKFGKLLVTRSLDQKEFKKWHLRY